jgi:hypothetical protein
MAAGETGGPDSGALFPLAGGGPPPAGTGPGWAKVAAAVEAQVPPAEIETIYVFRPIKRDGKEWGTAVITRKAADGRLRVYTAKYMLVVRGKERGQSKIDVTEVALSPAEVLAQVMQATVDRGGDTEPPAELGAGVWYSP